MRDKQIMDLLLLALHTGRAELDDFLTSLEDIDRHAVEEMADGLAQRAAYVSVYFGWRNRGASVDQAEVTANRRLRNVRKALGFSMP